MKTLATHSVRPLAQASHREQHTLVKAAKEFESLLLKQLISSMRSDNEDGLLGSSASAKTYNDLMDTELARALAEAGGIGLGKYLDGAVDKQINPARPPQRDIVNTLVADGKLTSSYGPRRDPIDGSEAFHRGIDIAAAAGSPIHATTSGVVKRAQDMNGLGLAVEIDHGNGVTSRYGHLQHTTLQPGDILKTGDVLGLVGSSGRSTGPHVHVELRVQGRAVDPLKAHWPSAMNAVRR